MNEKIFILSQREELAGGVLHIVLEGDTDPVKPGQFAEIELPGVFLRRPFAIRSCGDGRLDFLVKVAGMGTRALSRAIIGTHLNVLMPLGNGFDISEHGEKPVLVAGGIGLPSIFSLAKAMTEEGLNPGVILGFNTVSEMLPIQDFEDLGLSPVTATVDGSYGIKGNVVDVLKTTDFDYVFCCGPAPMLRAVYAAAPDGQFSLEARMGCGFGACMGCSIETPAGPKRICRDGPVFRKEELSLWAGAESCKNRT